jgi:LysM repeat protein
MTGRRKGRRRSQQEAANILGKPCPRRFRDSSARLQPGKINLPFAHRATRSRHRPLTHGLVLAIIAAAVGYGALTANGGFPGQQSAFAAQVPGLSMPSSAMAPAAVSTDSSVIRAPVIPITIRAEQPVSQTQKAEADRFVALGVTPTPEATAVAEDPLLRAASDAPAPVLPPYQVYTVVDGDTLSSIAERFGVSADYIAANNIELRNADQLTLGQPIIIPAGNGILHEIRYGETLSDIAARYGVDIEAITGFASNGITDPGAIAETQLVYVPNAALPTFEPVPEPAPEAGDGGGAPAGGFVSTGPSSGEGLIWPLAGPISSYYSAGHPLASTSMRSTWPAPPSVPRPRARWSSRAATPAARTASTWSW